MALKEGAHALDQVQIKKLLGAGVPTQIISQKLRIKESVVIGFQKWFEEKGDEKLKAHNRTVVEAHREVMDETKSLETAIKAAAVEQVVAGKAAPKAAPKATP